MNRYKYNRGERGFFPGKGWTDERQVAGPQYASINFSSNMSFKKKMSNFNSQTKNMNENCLTTAYWCRDQNFRKYFEIRKRHGISPSVDVKGFYNKDRIITNKIIYAINYL